MKHLISLLVVLLAATASVAKTVPTPDEAMSFAMGNDPRKWGMVFHDGDQRAIIAEFTIGNEDINHWSEMVAQQIDFTRLPLEEHFQRWAISLQRADPAIVIKGNHLPDGSILATYDSKAFDELSVRRFVKGSDGVYMLAYHVRHRLRNDETWQLWTTIVSQATLLANPAKGK